MSKYEILTTEHSFDDVPWFGDGETFSCSRDLDQRVRELKNIRRDTEVTISILRDGSLIRNIRLEEKL